MSATAGMREPSACLFGPDCLCVCACYLIVAVVRLGFNQRTRVCCSNTCIIARPQLPPSFGDPAAFYIKVLTSLWSGGASGALQSAGDRTSGAAIGSSETVIVSAAGTGSCYELFMTHC